MLERLLLSRIQPVLLRGHAKAIVEGGGPLGGHILNFVDELAAALEKFAPVGLNPEAWSRFSVLDVGCGSPETNQFLAQISGEPVTKTNDPWFCRIAAAAGVGRAVGLDVRPNSVETGWEFRRGNMLESAAWEGLGKFHIVHMNRVVPGLTNFVPSPTLQAILGIVDERGADPQAVFCARDVILGRINFVLEEGGILSWDGAIIPKSELQEVRELLHQPRRARE